MTTITVAKGDGIGPEIMDATLKIIMAAGAQLKIEEVQVGEKYTWPAIPQALPANHGIRSVVIKYF